MAPSTILENISLKIQHVCQGGLFRPKASLFASNLQGRPKRGGAFRPLTPVLCWFGFGHCLFLVVRCPLGRSTKRCTSQLSLVCVNAVCTLMFRCSALHPQRRTTDEYKHGLTIQTQTRTLSTARRGVGYTPGYQ